MALPANTLTTYAAKDNVEDLSNVIYRVAVEETPFMMNIGRGKAAATFHEWQTQGLAAAVDTNATLEGDDVVNSAPNITTRVGNYLQVSHKVPSVSGSQQAVKHAGTSDEMAMQELIKGIELRRDVEKQLLSNKPSGAGSAAVPRQSAGLESWLVTNDDRGALGAQGGFGASSAGIVDAPVDGTPRAFTETILKNVMISCFNAGSRPSQIYLGGANKVTFSGFTGIAAIRAQAPSAAAATIIGAADVYVSDFGTLTAIPSTFVRPRSALFVNPDMVSFDLLRDFHSVDIAKNGDSTRRQVLVEYTLKVSNEAAHGIAADLT